MLRFRFWNKRWNTPAGSTLKTVLVVLGIGMTILSVPWHELGSDAGLRTASLSFPQDVPPMSEPQGAQFSSLSVYKEENLLILSPPEESLYADGNRAQERLYSQIYAEFCGGHRDVDPLVIDVGGLLGDFGLKAAYAGCRVVSFEPQRKFANLIRASVLLNGLESIMTVVNAAVGEVHDRDLFYVQGSHGGNAAFFTSPTEDQTTIKIKSYRLDRLFDAFEDILLLKIDVEGFDVAVVHSADALLRRAQVKHMFFEFTPFWNGQGQGRWLDVLSWLDSLAPSPRMYALDRTGANCYGPILINEFNAFNEDHVSRHLQTDIYATWDDVFDPMCADAWNGTLFA